MSIINVTNGVHIVSELTVVRAKEIIDAQRAKNFKSVKRFFCCYDAVQDSETTIMFLAIGPAITTEEALIKVLTAMETYKLDMEERYGWDEVR